MGVKFERGPDGYALLQLWTDGLSDDDCDASAVTPPVVVLFTRGTLDQHRDQLLPEHFQGITDGGLIMGVDDEYGWVEVYPTRAELDKAWKNLLRSSHAWKSQRIDSLKKQSRQARALLRQAINAWPQFDSDQDVSGADLAEWFALWRRKAKACVAGADVCDHVPGDPD